jgi:hypothetical protein
MTVFSAFIQNDKETTVDLLNFNEYLETFKEIITNCETPITIGIHGKWGSGKTSLMRMIEKDLEKNPKIRTFWFNAWKYSKEEVLWTAFIQQMLNRIKSQRGLPRGVREKIKKMGIKISWLTARTTIKVATKGIIDIGEQVDENFSYQERIQFINEFEKEFQAIIDLYVPKDGKFVVFIDDLDRCLPERSIDILETIKLFLDVNKCIFFVAVDIEAIEMGITARYKEKNVEKPPVEGRDYIEKIIQLPFNLPPLKNAKIIAEGLETNPRKIKRFISVFEFQQILADKRKLDIDKELLAKYLLIQFRWPIFHSELILNLDILKDMERLSIFENNNKKKEIEKLLGEKIELKQFYENKKLIEFLKSEPFFKNVDLNPYIHLTRAIITKEEMEISADILTAKEKEVLKLVTEATDRNLGVSELAEARDISYTAARSLLESLKDKGAIGTEWEPKGKKKFYILDKKTSSNKSKTKKKKK